MPEIEVHTVPSGRLPASTLANAILQLYPPIKKADEKPPKQQKGIIPRDNEELVILGIEDGEVTAAAVGVVSLEIPAIRLSLLRGRSAYAVQCVVGALITESQQMEHVDTIFADAFAIVCKEEILEKVGFSQSTNSHYLMPAGMSVSV